MLATYYIFSGGIKVNFLGTNIDTIPFTLMVDIVNTTTSNTVLPMPYNIVSIIYLFSLTLFIIIPFLCLLSTGT